MIHASGHIAPCSVVEIGRRFRGAYGSIITAAHRPDDGWIYASDSFSVLRLFKLLRAVVGFVNDESGITRRKWSCTIYPESSIETRSKGVNRLTAISVVISVRAVLSDKECRLSAIL
jgi:hypothetical protein